MVRFTRSNRDPAEVNSTSGESGFHQTECRECKTIHGRGPKGVWNPLRFSKVGDGSFG